MAADLGHSADYNHKFWKKFRDAVKEANPNAIILAEHYGDPSSWLAGGSVGYDHELRCVHGTGHLVLTGMEKHSDDCRMDPSGKCG